MSLKKGEAFKQWVVVLWETTSDGRSNDETDGTDSTVSPTNGEAAKQMVDALRDTTSDGKSDDKTDGTDSTMSPTMGETAKQRVDALRDSTSDGTSDDETDGTNTIISQTEGEAAKHMVDALRETTSDSKSDDETDGTDTIVSHNDSRTAGDGILESSLINGGTMTNDTIELSPIDEGAFRERGNSNRGEDKHNDETDRACPTVLHTGGRDERSDGNGDMESPT